MRTTIYAVGDSGGFVLNVILQEVLPINVMFTGQVYCLYGQVLNLKF